MRGSRHPVSDLSPRQPRGSSAHSGTPPTPLGASASLLRVGFGVVAAAVGLQTAAHLLNALLLGQRSQLNVNLEGNVFAWASASAMFAAGFVVFVHALTFAKQRALCLALTAVLTFFSLDDMIGIHKRGGLFAAELLGLGEVFDSVLWPTLYIPLLAFVAAALIAIAREAPRDVRRSVWLGLGLLALAVTAEVASAPWSVSTNAFDWPHVVEGAIEEGAELGGTIVIAAALTTLLQLRLMRLGATRELPRGPGCSDE